MMMALGKNGKARSTSLLVRMLLLGVLAVLLLNAQTTGAAGGCNDACSSHDDCAGSLACMNHKCDDDPDVGTDECKGSGGAAGAGCFKKCRSHDDCEGVLACINKQCNDDPDVGSNVCGGGGGGGECKPFGSMVAPWIDPNDCNPSHGSECCETGKRYNLYDCSPPVSSATKGHLTLNGFGPEEDGGGPGACFGKYYRPVEKVVAMSTGWYANSKRCGKKIRVTRGGRSVVATVVDECDTRAGCDEEHAFQPPCPHLDDVDGSPAVWAALGISTNDPEYGLVDITWSDVTGVDDDNDGDAAL